MADDENFNSPNSPLTVPKSGAAAQIKGNKQDNSANQKNLLKQLQESRRIYNNERNNLNEMNRRTRFFKIVANDGTNLSTIDTIKAYDDLKRHLKGTPKKISERRDGSLTIILDDVNQCNLLPTINKLAGVDVTCTSDDKLNQIQGTTRYDNHPKYSIEKLKETLKDQNVIDIFQLSKRNKDKTKTKVPIYILTFNTTSLPSRITIGWSNCPVRLYIPKPRLCYKCYGIGHGSTTCRSEIEVCAICAQQKHEGTCTTPTKCRNCSGDHPSYIRNCPVYQKEQEILAFKVKNQITYAEAKKEINKRFPTSANSYSAAVKSKQPQTSSQPVKINDKETHMDINNNNPNWNNGPTASSIPTHQPRCVEKKQPTQDAELQNNTKRQREERNHSTERSSKRPPAIDQKQYRIQMNIPSELPSSTAKKKNQSSPSTSCIDNRGDNLSNN